MLGGDLMQNLCAWKSGGEESGSIPSCQNALQEGEKWMGETWKK
jgi:hypothetical protein